MAEQENNEDRLDEQIIPLSFVGSGRCFNGIFKQINLIEGFIIAIPGMLLTFKVIHWSSLQWEVYGGLLLIGIPLIFGIIGINDDDIFSYLLSLIKFERGKRVVKYNPRAKAEINPDYIYSSEGNLPRDKIERLVNEVLHRNDSNGDDLSPDITAAEYQKMYFNDDIDVAGKYGAPELPDELKSKKAKKKEMKEKKKQEREQNKRARKERARLKLLRRKDGGEAKKNEKAAN